MKNFEVVAHNSFFMSSSKNYSLLLLFFYLQTIQSMSSYKRRSEIL